MAGAYAQVRGCAARVATAAFAVLACLLAAASGPAARADDAAGAAPVEAIDVRYIDQTTEGGGDVSADIAGEGAGAGAGAGGFTSGRTLELTFPLTLDGRYLGDILVRLGASGEVSFPLDRFEQLLGSTLTEPSLEEIRALAQDGRLAPFEAPGSGVRVFFDTALQELRAEIPSTARSVESISMVSDIARAFGSETERAEKPSPMAFYVNLEGFQSYVHEQPNDVTGREAAQGTLDAGVRLFGDRGVALEARGLYQEDAEQEFRRGEARLVYDHVPSRISASLGDIRYGVAGFQAGPAMGGFAVERLFSLQPYRSFRPAGRRAISLDRRTDVTVLVNGAEIRRIELEPGRYELEDFPFVDGANDIELVMIDEAGNRETISVRGFFDSQLLAPGLSEFSYAIGFPSTTESEEIVYDEEAFYSLFHRIGVLSNLTLGVNAQGDADATVVGGDALVASPVGVFGLDYAHSDNSFVGTGDAAILRYEFTPKRGGDWAWNIGMSTLWQSEGFVTPDAEEAAVNAYDYQTDLAFRLSEARLGSVSLGLGHDRARDAGTDDRYEASLGYSRRLFGNLYGNIRTRYIDDGVAEETSASITLSWRINTNNNVTTRYDSGTGQGEIDYRRTGGYGVGGVSMNARVGYNDISDEAAVGGSLNYLGNRFEASLNNDTRTVGLEGEELTSRSSARVGVGIAAAGPHVAVGRPVRGAFAIVRGHPSLEGRPIRLGGAGDSMRATTGLFGPALISDLHTYLGDSVPVEVDDLPPGYDLGSGQLDFVAYRGAGYDVRVGSGASATVLATLVAPNDIPITLTGGELRSLDDPDREPVRGFTNRSARFAVVGVAPGRYRLVMFSDPQTETIIEIPEGSVGLVQLGEIMLEEAE